MAHEGRGPCIASRLARAASTASRLAISASRSSRGGGGGGGGSSSVERGDPVERWALKGKGGPVDRALACPFTGPSTGTPIVNGKGGALISSAPVAR